MANPVPFTPKEVNPRLELQRRLEAAPTEHAEALLVAYDLLEEAHKQGVLDLLHGMVGAKSTIFRELSLYGTQPTIVNAMRNLLIAADILGTLKPESFSQFSRNIKQSQSESTTRKESPSLWQILRYIGDAKTRRGIWQFLKVLNSLGASTEE